MDYNKLEIKTKDRRMKYLFHSKFTEKPNLKQNFFMNASPQSMTHCPKCSKPLLNGGQFSGWAEFSMRCPWCQAIVVVSIQPKITTTLKLEHESFTDEPVMFSRSPKGE